MNDDHLLLVDRPWADRFWAIASAGVFAVLSLACGIAGEGFLEADGCTHYLFSRFAIDFPYLLVDIWGRPLVTAVYALPAYFGQRPAVRITSLLMALLCAFAVYRVAKNQGYRWPSVAVIALCAQPLFFLHSFAELTELPFALLVILAFWAYQLRLWMVMTVLVALLPLGRPEGFGFMIAATVALLLHRRPWWIVILPLPLVIWSWVGWVQYGSPAELPWWNWLRANWPYEAQSNYGAGPIWHYVAHLPAVVAPLLLPATLAGGVWGLARAKAQGRREKAEEEHIGDRRSSFILLPSSVCLRLSIFTSHQARCDFVLTALPFGILLVHSIFWSLGKFSGGELRYLLVVAPLWALVTARGVQWLAEILRLRRVVPIVVVLAMLPVLANKFWTVLPIAWSPDEQTARRIAVAYRADPALQQHYPRIVTPSPAVYYFLDIWNNDGFRALPWNRQSIESAPPGVLLVYEDILANYNSDKRMVVPRELIEQSGWVLQCHYAKNWSVYLSPHRADGSASTRDDH